MTVLYRRQLPLLEAYWYVTACVSTVVEKQKFSSSIWLH